MQRKLFFHFKALFLLCYALLWTLFYGCSLFLHHSFCNMCLSHIFFAKYFVGEMETATRDWKCHDMQPVLVIFSRFLLFIGNFMGMKFRYQFSFFDFMVLLIGGIKCIFEFIVFHNLNYQILQKWVDFNEKKLSEFSTRSKLFFHLSFQRVVLMPFITSPPDHASEFHKI